MGTLRAELHSVKRKMQTLITIGKDSLHTLREIGIDLETEILLLCHALEKGMGIKQVKSGYGQEKTAKLIELLAKYKKQAGTSNYTYQEAVGVLNAYFLYQKSLGIDLSSLENKFHSIEPSSSQGLKAGYDILHKEDFVRKSTWDFEDFINARRSCRNFSTEKIESEQMESVLRQATKAPSACNRQPWKVYYSLDIDKNRQLTRLIPGNKSFMEEIPYYCVVTVDKKYFGGNEAYQWYVNGGIFLDHLVLSMHSQGIGSCIFQWPEFYETENQLRSIINKITPSEVIIAVVGYGIYPDEGKYLCASRRPITEIGMQF